jgi:spore germination protein KB
MVLGPRQLISTSASFAVSRQIDIGNVLSRLDILVAIVLLITVFMKVVVFYYVTVLGIAQTCKLRSYAPLVIPIGIISIIIAANLYPSDMEQLYAGQYAWPFNASICELVLPVITLVVIAIRRLPKKKGAK